MDRPALFPATVTPFDAHGRVDLLGVARLLAWYEHAGCRGVVLAGTNGEGPSLSAVEKRDLLIGAKRAAGNLELILGISTPSSDEAIWLCKQTANAGGNAVLLMPPGYFREATDEGLLAWFRLVLDRSPVPVIVYNFPKRTGLTLSSELLAKLADHDRFAGVKDSSGERENLSAYRQAVPDHPLHVGDETLLLEALAEGWTGSISGAANVVPLWLAEVLRQSDDTKFALLKPLLEEIRRRPQPASHKALLHLWGILPCPDVRLPLLAEQQQAAVDLDEVIARYLGQRGGMLAG